MNQRKLPGPFQKARDFVHMEASGGIVLIFASAIALLIANSALYPLYHHTFNGITFTIGFTDLAGGRFELSKTLLHWINDGLMVIFFFLVGLEIKEEMKEGGLSSISKIMLPTVAAVGGIIAPAFIYYYLNQSTPANLHGWAIPTATDIAFALCVLSLLGSRVPASIKVLLTAIAIIDDIGAIIIIGIFYSDSIAPGILLFCLAPITVLFALNRRGVTAKGPYLMLGLVLWLAVLESGVHATLAGVITAFFIPVRGKDTQITPNSDLQAGLHPWVAFLVLPVFGFANAGVPLDGMGWKSLLEPVTLGIASGLFIGKQIGVFTFLRLSVLLGLAPKPEGASWFQLYAMAILCGIGFTMSLFIGGLAFSDLHTQADVRLGVLAGSILSAAVAAVLLLFGTKRGA